MAHLWPMDTPTSEPLSLQDSPFDLDTASPRAAGEESDVSHAILTRTDGAGDAWCLVAGRGAPAFVNGEPLLTGIRVLRDRDEIRLPRAGRWYFFGTERLARVVPYPGPENASCPRCRQPIPPGTDAVLCPGCGLWHHASEALPCWGYAETCAMCSHPTALEAGYRWTPEAL